MNHGAPEPLWCVKVADLKKIQKKSKKRLSIGLGFIRVRYTMNSFVNALGSSVIPLSEKVKAMDKQLGKVSVNMGKTACKVPLASATIQKVIDANKLGRKKKVARC
jgi:hypothetical protein